MVIFEIRSTLDEQQHALPVRHDRPSARPASHRPASGLSANTLVSELSHLSCLGVLGL
jgi:hypothetical protein